MLAVDHPPGGPPCQDFTGTLLAFNLCREQARLNWCYRTTSAALSLASRPSSCDPHACQAHGGATVATSLTSRRCTGAQWCPYKCSRIGLKALAVLAFLALALAASQHHAARQVSLPVLSCSCATTSPSRPDRTHSGPSVPKLWRSQRTECCHALRHTQTRVRDPQPRRPDPHPDPYLSTGRCDGAVVLVVQTEAQLHDPPGKPDT